MKITLNKIKKTAKVSIALLLAVAFVAVMVQPVFALTYSLVLGTGANAGTNVVFTNAIYIKNITVANNGGTNHQFTLFNSGVRSNQYAVPVFTNYLRTVALVTNVYTNINIANSTDIVSTNAQLQIVWTTNTDLATNRTYPFAGPYGVYTNTPTALFNIESFYSHGLVITNTMQAAGSVSYIINYSPMY